jgi:hypothetical protein
MKDIITAAKVLKHLCLWVITGSTLYMAMWFYHYEQMIL